MCVCVSVSRALCVCASVNRGREECEFLHEDKRRPIAERERRRGTEGETEGGKKEANITCSHLFLYADTLLPHHFK